MSGKNRVIAIDPGVNFSGWSVFIEEEGDTWRLEEAGFMPSDHWPESAKNMWPYAQVTLVIEQPEKYPTKTLYHSDLANLDAVVHLMAEYASDMSWETKKVKPATWKAQVPKKVHHHRISSELSQVELDSVFWPPASACHNVFDAIGLGLYQVKRLGRGGKKLST
jgi:hypothetical protein